MINKDTQLCMSLSGRPGNTGTYFHNYLYQKLGLNFVWLCHNKQLINSHFYRGALKLPYKFELSKIVKPYRLLFFLLLLKQYL